MRGDIVTSNNEKAVTMKNLRGKKGQGLIILIALFFVAIVAGFCWSYTINFWLAHAGKTGRIAFWQACLLGFVPYVGQLSIPGAVVTWLISFFL
jgi:hypothetical protein